MNTSRLFIAVALPDSIIHEVEELASKSKAGLPFQKWTHPTDYHITLKFLGDTGDDQIPAIKEEVESAISEIASPFTLAIDELGTFGKPASPSILWLGVAGQLPELNRLQASIDEATAKVGFSLEERAYNPHITIARRYQGKSAWNADDLKPLYTTWKSNLELNWQVSDIVLYRSHPKERPMYEPILRWQL
ncbi:RNA 2',3'-cyclic phosphodiesterase [Paenibacillus albiflavus]|uniref:RNA 2',3'-cyclic phosphodiesterase n=1 Tax=Paenibacillus albiflavus TaxID=2545760 RepID=UPI0014050671|nr:RNA 2',3'-cyclic phosphodiesterase [Paenibacillus albiflavus]